MSDPVVPEQEDKPVDVNDVVERANEGLAAAEAASESTADAASETVADAVDPDLAAFEAAERDHPGTFAASVDAAPPAPVAEPVAPAEPIVAEPAAVEPVVETVVAPAVIADEVPTTVVPSEPIVEAAYAPAPTPAPAPQPIFVQAPEAPRPKGNRGTAGLIGLLAAVTFGILYLGTALGIAAVDGNVTASNIVDALLSAVTSWWFWAPVALFFIGFWLLGAIINRGRWGSWVIFGLIVGVFAYGGHLLGQLLEAPFWVLTASQGFELVQGELFAPLAVAAFIFGREVTIWFGAWAAKSGARKTELNEEAQREYERTLEAGPTLSR